MRLTALWTRPSALAPPRLEDTAADSRKYRPPRRTPQWLSRCRSLVDQAFCWELTEEERRSLENDPY